MGIRDNLIAKLNPNKIKINHGLEMTLDHLKEMSEQELQELYIFLEGLPSFIIKKVNGKKYVAVHGFWAEWMLNKELKSFKEKNLYGIVNKTNNPSELGRINWWEREEYLPKNHVVIFGHYAQKVDLPTAKCVDTGACFGGTLSAFIPSEEGDIWVEVQSNWDYDEYIKDEVLSKVDSALDYNQIFNFINDDQLKLVNEIENNDQLKKTRYLINLDNEIHEIVVANAKKTLFTPSVTSYSEQVSKGIVYNKTTSEIISITLFKCYNFNENKSVNKKFFELLSDPNLRIECTDKLDGTQIYRFAYKGKVFWGTRSLLISEPNQIEEGNTDFFNLVKETKNFALLNDPNYEPDKTLIFELLHPDNRTIVQYKDEPLLRCLGFSIKEGKRWIGQFSPLTCDTQLYPTDLLLQTDKIDDAVDLLKKLNKEGSLIEGFVANIVNKQDQVLFRVKFKTDLFFETMRLLTHCTYDNTVELCLTNNLITQDDFVNYLKQDKDKFPEELLEQYILFFNQYQEYIMNCNKYIELLQSYYEQLIKSNNFSSKKDFALFIQDLPFKGFLFSLYDNKRIDLDKTFKYDLKEVINRINELY